MNQSNLNKLYDRITYLVFSIMLCLTMLFPMFSIKYTVGENSDVTCSSISAIQIMRVGLSSKEDRDALKVSLKKDCDEYVDKLQKDGKSDADIENKLKVYASFNEYSLIEVFEKDEGNVIMPMAICLLVAYSLLALLALLYFVSILVRKSAFDTVNIFVNIAAAVASIVAMALSFTLTISNTPVSSYLICSELVMYVFAIAPVALALIQAIRLFVSKKQQKVKESEIIVPFTAKEQESETDKGE